MTLKPLVTIDKAWYKQNRVNRAHVSTEKLKQEAKRKRQEFIDAHQMKPAKKPKLFRYRESDFAETVDDPWISAEHLIDKAPKVPQKRKFNNRRKSYHRFLRSLWWRQFRYAIISMRGGECERCGCRYNLQVHHVFYPEDWYKTLPIHVVLLCGTCHEYEHSRFPRHGDESRLGPGEAKEGTSTAARRGTSGTGKTTTLQNRMGDGRSCKMTSQQLRSDGSPVLPRSHQGLPA